MNRFWMPLLLIVMGFAPPAEGADDASLPPFGVEVPLAVAAGEEGGFLSGGLNLRITPYLWMVGINGDMATDALEADVDEHFDEILDYLKIGAMIRGEAWIGRFGLTTDFFLSDLGEEHTHETGERFGRIFDFLGITRPAEVEVEFFLRQVMVEFGAGVRPVDVDVWKDARLYLDVLGGGRYWFLKTYIDFDPGPRMTEVLDWVDLYIGGRIAFSPTPGATIAVRGDAGGFGIGSGSELTYNIVVETEFDLTESVALAFGYRLLNLDYSRGGGATRLALDLTYSGPYIGCTIGF